MFTTPANCFHPEPSEPAARLIELAERILVCGRMFRDELTQQTGRWQLSGPEFSVLWVCRGAPSAGLGQSEFAAKLAVSAAKVSGLVERLRRQGLLEGRRAEADRRRQLWRLTTAGRARLQAVLADLADWAGPLDHSLEVEYSDALMRLLDLLAKVLRTRSGSHAAARPTREGFDHQVVQSDGIHRAPNRKGAA